jgi:Ser/Thr protein kinase RdoA (MazF antagonist)
VKVTTRFERWCDEHLGAVPVEEVFRHGYLSTVIGVRLADGHEVVVKLRAQSPRLDGCVEVQRRLASRGFPCPEPLSAVLSFDGYAATVEAYVPGGESLPRSGRQAAPFAAAFARLVSLAPTPDEVPGLRPSPPWTDWDHNQPGLWPKPDDHDKDLNLAGGAIWIDHAGQEARTRLHADRALAVVAHGDWYPGNVRWREDELHVVHDWDSTFADSEAAAVGFAAAVYPALHAGGEATVEETEAFIDAYLSQRQRSFDRDELESCWAAGVWIRAFDSKKQHAMGQPVRSLTEGEAHERLRRAGTR